MQCFRDSAWLFLCTVLLCCSCGHAKQLHASAIEGVQLSALSTATLDMTIHSVETIVQHGEDGHADTTTHTTVARVTANAVRHDSIKAVDSVATHTEADDRVVPTVSTVPRVTFCPRSLLYSIAFACMIFVLCLFILVRHYLT